MNFYQLTYTHTHTHTHTHIYIYRVRFKCELIFHCEREDSRERATWHMQSEYSCIIQTENVPFTRKGNQVNKVTIRINGSSLGLSFAPRGAGSNPVRDKAVVSCY